MKISEMSNPVPLTIISGFLGSGKTTLLNRILKADHGLRVAVLVNDFGAINVDAQLVVGVDGDTINLSNGCICCTIRGDLLQATLNLFKRPEPPEYIIVETSGVSDPLEVAMTFQAPQVSSLVSVDSIITVVDAEQIRDLDKAYEILAFCQVSLADLIVLNKVDLATTEQLAKVKKWIHDISPRARVLDAVQADVPLELLLGVGQFAPERLASTSSQDIHIHTADSDHDHDHTHTDHSLVFSTWSWTTEKPLHAKTLKKAIETLPVSIYRAKGFVYLIDQPEKRGVLHVVGKRAELTLEPKDPAISGVSQIVVIGSQGGLDVEALTQRFEGCIAEHVPPSPLEKIQQRVTTWLRGS